jgi:hypothetical protein
MSDNDRDIDEDDILDDKEVVMNQRLKAPPSKGDLALNAKPDIDGTFAKFKTTEDMRLEIEKMSKKLEEDQIIKEKQEAEARGEGEDSEYEMDKKKRIEEMRNPENRKFNVNDILGEFDRDERGHPLILQDKKGELIDKEGNRVNEKGYLVDPKTGDVLERS